MRYNGVRPLGLSDQYFYYVQSGLGASFNLRLHVNLRDALNRTALQDAAQKALKNFPEFSVRPVVQEEHLFYEENDSPVSLFDDDGTFHVLGSDETNGYLFCLRCRDDGFTFSYYHGMTDILGAMVFLRTILCFYAGMTSVQENGLVRFSAEPSFLMDETERFDPYRKFAAESFTQQEYDAFVIPEKNYPGDPAYLHLFNVKVRTSDFIARTKELGTSFIPLMSIIFSGAVTDMYGFDESRPVIAMVPVNLRPVFGTETLVNISDGIMLPYSRELASKPIREQGAEIRAQMKSMITRGNFADVLAAKSAAVQAFRSSGDTLNVTAERFTRPAPEGTKRPLTYALTYPGRMDLPEAFSELVRSIDVDIIARAFGAGVYTYGDDMTFQFMQRFDTDAVIRSVMSRLESLGVMVQSLEDRGRVMCDKVLAERLKRI